MLAIGVMSGTSLDGVDVVLCRLEGALSQLKVEVVDSLTLAYPPALLARVKHIVDQKPTTIADISSLNFELGHWYADAIETLLSQTSVTPSAIEFIANHGQTLYHEPKAEADRVDSTLQMGESSVIAYRLGIDVIDNFRVMDVAAHGQGAPLVPFSERVLYQAFPKPLALLNLGGIANVTFLDEEDTLAFDCGPANMMINEAMQRFYQKPYDQDGQIAAQGSVHQGLLERMMKHPFLAQKPPKSTGREAFGQPYVNTLLKQYSTVAPADVVATFTAFTALSIEQALTFLPKPLTTLVVSGGGVHNSYLMNLLRKRLDPTPVLTQEELGYSSDMKEAIAFVVLGYAFKQGQASNVPAVTGAQHAVILGKLTPKPHEGATHD